MHLLCLSKSACTLWKILRQSLTGAHLLNRLELGLLMTVPQWLDQKKNFRAVGEYIALNQWQPELRRFHEHCAGAVNIDDVKAVLFHLSHFVYCMLIIAK